MLHHKLEIKLSIEATHILDFMSPITCLFY